MHDVGLMPISSKLAEYLVFNGQGGQSLTFAASTSSRKAPSASFLPFIFMLARNFWVDLWNVTPLHDKKIQTRDHLNKNNDCDGTRYLSVCVII